MPNFGEKIDIISSGGFTKIVNQTMGLAFMHPFELRLICHALPKDLLKIGEGKIFKLTPSFLTTLLINYKCCMV